MVLRNTSPKFGMDHERNIHAISSFVYDYLWCSSLMEKIFKRFVKFPDVGVIDTRGEYTQNLAK